MMNETKRVTDPVTHLPLDIHDRTSLELENIPSGAKPADNDKQSPQQNEKVNEAVERATEQWTARPGEASTENRRRAHAAFIALVAFGAGAASLSVLKFVVGVFQHDVLLTSTLTAVGIGAMMVVVVAGVYTSIPLPAHDSHTSSTAPTDSLQRRQSSSHSTDIDSESPEWLNALLSSLWPIINPSLFVVLVDMLEDQMQATLPPFIHSLRVADIGQGSVPPHILSVRHLPAGQADEDIDGLKAEQGEFINLEVALSYRGSDDDNNKSKNAHMLMEFFTVAGVTLPAWITLTGLLIHARIRIQLTSNPPFVSMMTSTLLGQPKVSFSATPLVKKKWLNVMDVPGLSNWLQSAVDEAVKSYVAPRSLDIDLGSILGVPSHIGDVSAHGVLFIRINSADDFKSADGAQVWKSESGRRGDVYVTVGWAKWGKKMWATKVIDSEHRPVWHQSTALLVNKAEMNAMEAVRVQLWDSDSFTSDDLIGTVDVPLSELIQDKVGEMKDREDRWMNVDSGKHVPGTLSWSIGYFAKTGIEACVKDEHKVKEIQDEVDEEAERKLREARHTQDEREEVEQLKAEDLEERSNAIIASHSPSAEFPSGILKIRIVEIEGLELVHARHGRPDGQVEGEGAGEEETGRAPASSYCEIIVNQERWYKTRTKIRSGKPYFDAGTERFIRDWQTTAVIVAVRDFRLHESDPLLGVVSLPLHSLLSAKSHISDSFPLVGGMGVGKVLIEVTFRSVKIELGREDRLGWNVGTLSIHPRIHLNLNSNCGDEDSTMVDTNHVIVQTRFAKRKLVQSQDDSTLFTPKPHHHHRGGEGEEMMEFPIQNRPAECVVFQFEKRGGLGDGVKVGRKVVEAYAVLWIGSLSSSSASSSGQENEEITLNIYKGSETDMNRAMTCRTQHDIGEDTHLTLSVRLGFTPGMGKAHRRLGKKDVGVRDVLEVLECVSDEGVDGMDRIQHGRDDGYSSSSSSGSSSSDDSDDSGEDEQEGEEEENKSRLGQLKAEIKSYETNHTQLHRHHHGIMQWKTARRAVYIKKGIEKKVNRVGEKAKEMVTNKGPLDEIEKGPGVENEIS